MHCSCIARQKQQYVVICSSVSTKEPITLHNAIILTELSLKGTAAEDKQLLKANHQILNNRILPD